MLNDSRGNLLINTTEHIFISFCLIVDSSLPSILVEFTLIYQLEFLNNFVRGVVSFPIYINLDHFYVFSCFIFFLSYAT